MTTPERPFAEMAVAHLDGCACPDCAHDDNAQAADRREQADCAHREAWGEDNPRLFTGGEDYEN